MLLKVRDHIYHMEIHQHKDLPFLILLHGFMGSGQVFRHLLPGLKAFANPVTIDLLGHGATGGDEQPERYRAGEQIKDLFILIKNLHPAPVFLHGYSMGGRLALRYALHHPDAISGLILESTTYGMEQDEEQAQRLLLDEQRARAIETDYNGFLDSWVQLPLFSNSIQVPSYLKQRYRGIQQSQSPSSMAGSLRGFGAACMPSVKSDLDKLNVPALILAGGADAKYRALAKEMHRAIPDSKMSIIEQAGHRIHLENPEAFVSEVKLFLLKNSGVRIQSRHIPNSDS